MTPRPPKLTPAVLVDLSQQTRAVIHGRGSVTLLRGREAIAMSDSEAWKLVAAHTAFCGPPHDPVVCPEP